MLSAYSSEYLQTDASDVWELFFETHLIWDISNNVHTLQNPHCKNIWWNYNKNESFKSYLGNKEQKLLFLVVSQLDLPIEIDFAPVFFACPIRVQMKLRPQIIGRVEVNLSSPGLLMTLHTFVFIQITSLVKPVYIFMVKSRAS